MMTTPMPELKTLYCAQRLVNTIGTEYAEQLTKAICELSQAGEGSVTLTFINNHPHKVELRKSFNPFMEMT